MMYKWTYTTGTINKADRAWYDVDNNGFKCTGETLTERYEETTEREAGATTYVVMRATGQKWTPYQMCRDCGDHYIIAKHSYYVRIDKGTLKRTVDVDDN